MLGLATLGLGIALRLSTGVGFPLETVGLFIIVATPVSFLILLASKGLSGEDRRTGFLALITLLVIALSVMVSLR